MTTSKVRARSAPSRAICFLAIAALLSSCSSSTVPMRDARYGAGGEVHLTRCDAIRFTLPRGSKQLNSFSPDSCGESFRSGGIVVWIDVGGPGVVSGPQAPRPPHRRQPECEYVQQTRFAGVVGSESLCFSEGRGAWIWQLNVYDRDRHRALNLEVSFTDERDRAAALKVADSFSPIGSWSQESVAQLRAARPADAALLILSVLESDRVPIAPEKLRWLLQRTFWDRSPQISLHLLVSSEDYGCKINW